MVESRIILTEVANIKVAGKIQKCYQAWIEYPTGGRAPVLITYKMMDAARKLAIDNPELFDGL